MPLIMPKFFQNGHKNTMLIENERKIIDFVCILHPTRHF